MDPKKVTLVALLFQLVVSFGYCIAAFIVTTACFKKVENENDVCPEGTGVDMLFRIKKGEGFLAVMGALTSFGLCIATIYLLNRGTRTIYYGALIGMNWGMTVVALMIAACFGSYSLMMADFDCKDGIFLFVGAGTMAQFNLPPGQEFSIKFENLVCDGVGKEFETLVIFASIYFVVQLFINAALWMWKGDFINDGLAASVGGSSTPGAYDNIGDMKQGGLYSTPPTADL